MDFSLGPESGQGVPAESDNRKLLIRPIGLGSQRRILYGISWIGI